MLSIEGRVRGLRGRRHAARRRPRAGARQHHLPGRPQRRRQVDRAEGGQRAAAAAPGTITLDGARSAAARRGDVLRSGVVHVPQERSLFPGMTVWDNLLMGALHRARPAARCGGGPRPWPSGSHRPRAGRRAGRVAVRGPAEDRRDRPRADAGAERDPDGRAVDGPRPEGPADGVRHDLGAEQRAAGTPSCWSSRTPAPGLGIAAHRRGHGLRRGGARRRRAGHCWPTPRWRRCIWAGTWLQPLAGNASTTDHV